MPRKHDETEQARVRRAQATPRQPQAADGAEVDDWRVIPHIRQLFIATCLLVGTACVIIALVLLVKGNGAGAITSAGIAVGVAGGGAMAWLRKR